MSFIGDLAFDDQRALERDALANPALTPPEPSFWDGSGTALFSGIAQGATQLALQAAQYGNDPSQAILLDIPTDEDELARRDAVADQRHWVTDRLRPNAQTSGTAAQVLFGLGDAVTRFAVGGASGGLPVAAGAVGASMGEQRYSELRREGVDTGTAVLAGAIEGGAVAAGAFLPAARLLAGPVADAAATVGANVALGGIARGGVGTVLERNGYTQQAQQYKALDATAMAIDGLLGGAFWGLGRAMSRTASPETIDAALAGNNGLHAQHGTAPGAPVDARSSAAHQNALDLAIQQMSRGEPVNVSGMLDDAAFIRSDRIGPEPEVIRQQAQQDVFAAARAELEPVAAAGLPDAPSLRADLEQLRQNLASRDDRVWRTATDLQRDGMSNRKARRAAEQEVDERLSGTQARIAEIEERLAGNREAERANAELDAMARGETPVRLEPEVARRAEEMGRAFKRSALASSIAPDHGLTMNRLASQEIQRLLREGGQPVDELPTAAILGDESVAPAARTERGDALPPADPVPAAARSPELSGEQQAARAEDAPPEATVAGARPDGAEPAPAGELDGIDPALPDLIDSIVFGGRDMQIPTGAVGEDGLPVTVSARELLAEADAEIARAANDSKGFIAAALCALRFGD